MEETHESGRSEEVHGVTFGDIFRAVGKRKWLVLLVTLLFAAVAVLAAIFLYDPFFSTYSRTFTLSYPDSGAGKFPDGSPFNYRDIVSLDALTQTKNADGRFAAIDVEKLSERDAVTITQVQQQTAGELTQPTDQYTITVKARYFSGKGAATEFLNALARQPILKAVQIARTMNYSLDESSFENADFESRLELLSAQKENLLAQYDAWIALYRGNYTAAGRTLVNHRAEIDVAFGDVLQRSLSSELETNGYVSLQLLPAQRAALEAEKAENEQKISALLGALGPSAAALTLSSAAETSAAPVQQAGLSETLAALLVRNVEIDSQLKALTEENVTAFETKLKNVYQALQEAAAKAQAVGYALYEQEARVYFETSQAVQEGDISPVLAAVGGLVVGLIVACIIACAVELPKRKSSAEET